MPFTYSGDPSSADKDAVRFEIGDTLASAPIFQDAEIDWAILNETGVTAGSPTTMTTQNVYRSGARCLEVLAGQLAAQADSTVGSLKLQYSKAAQNTTLRAKQLRDRAIGMTAPYAGGQSISEKEGFRQNDDLAVPLFTRREFDNPYAGAGGVSASWPDYGPPTQ
jgi:hypothetical protein